VHLCFIWLPEQAALISPTKAAFNSKRDFNLTKTVLKYYIRSTAVYGAEIGALRKVGQGQLEGPGNLLLKKREISWTDSVKNLLLQKVKDRKNMLRTEGTGTRGRRRKQLLDKLQEERR